MGLVIFYAVVIVVDGLLHLYLWKRLVHDTMRRRWLRRGGAGVAVLLAVLLPATMIASRNGQIGELAWFGFLWLALMFYLFLLLAVLEIPRLVVALLRRRGRRTQETVDLAAKPAEIVEPAVIAPADGGGTSSPIPAMPGPAVARPVSPTRSADGDSEHARDLPGRERPQVERPGVERAGTIRTGAERTGTDWSGMERTGTGRTSPERTGVNQAGTTRTGADLPGTEQTGVNRRLLLARGAAIFAGLTAASITGYGVKTALGPPQLDRVQIPLAKLPRALDGTRLAVVSDIHLGPLAGSHHVGRIVDLINSVNADIVCVVGDLVDGSVAELGRYAQPLARVESRQGAYFVTGNHEYYSGFQQWVDEVTRLGIRPLRNERVALGGLDLAGVNDLGGVNFGDPADFGKALGDRDTSRPVVLMAHQPIAVHHAARYGVDLQVSGHTHGGQVAPFNLVVRLQQPVVSGLGRVDGVPVYVTNGAGFWGPPVRVGAPPQVTVIDLRTP